MSYPNVQMLQNSLNNPFKDIPAGKPTYYDNSNKFVLHYEPNIMELKSSKRSINHRNKDSLFDISHNGIDDKDVDPNNHNNSDIDNSFKKKKTNSSLDIKNIFHNDTESIPDEKYGKKIIQDVRNIYLFSNECNDTNDNKSGKKISSYILEKNPYKWGVDVFMYNLPSPKRSHKHVDNLSACLVPNISVDLIPHKKKKKGHQITQLEKSLCPKEDFIPNSRKKQIHIHESNLDINYVPKNFEEIRAFNKSTYNNGNLNADLIPLVDNDRKSLYISTECRKKICPILFNYDHEPLSYKSGKRIGYVCSNNENPVFLF